MAQLQITQERSIIGAKHNQRETLKSLGLRGINKVVVREDTPVVRGMINVVSHLVRVEEVK
ncbi:MAG: 50S ribosomal protein L30 [Corynebacteriales bacterium]|nr:50S ribosomal protein L30 [Mycobacteriales bacterium]